MAPMPGGAPGMTPVPGGAPMPMPGVASGTLPLMPSGGPGVTPMPMGAEGIPGSPGIAPMPGLAPGSIPMPGAAPALTPAPGGFPGAGVPGFPGVPGAGPGASPGASPGAVAPPEPKTLQDFVLLALSEGRDHDAYQLLCLDAVANGKSLENMKWYPGIRRNAPAIRFGIGIVYSGSRAVPSPEPIGHSGKSGAAGAPGMGPGMAPNMAGGPGGQQGGRNRPRTQRGYGQQQDPNQQPSKPELFKAPTEPAAMLAFYTGELGDKVLKNLRKRFDKGDFGLAMKEASKVRPAAAAVGGAPGGFPGGAMMPGGIPGPGAAMAGAAMPGAGGGAADVPAANGDQLQPGVTMLGEGKQSELLKAAAEGGIDVLIIYDIEVARGTVSPVNTTKIVLLNVSTKETIHSGSNLINGQVNKARGEEEGRRSCRCRNGTDLHRRRREAGGRQFPGQRQTG